MGERLRKLNAKYAEKLEMKRKEKRDPITQDLQEKKGENAESKQTKHLGEKCNGVGTKITKHAIPVKRCNTHRKKNY